MSIYVKIQALTTFALLASFFGICYFSQLEKSVTVDEFCHFPAAIYNIRSADWRMDIESPPLIKCYTAITSLFSKPKINMDEIYELKMNAWALGYYFMYSNKERYHDIFQYGRCSVILIGCFLGWLIYRFGTALYGYAGAHFALFMYVFNPNIIAHSTLTTIDIGASCFIFFSIYLFWIYLKRRDFPSAIFAGVALGMAQLSKFTALLLYPILIVIILFLAAKQKKKIGRHNEDAHAISLKGICYFLMIFLISIVVLNAGYFFSGSFNLLGDYHFSSNLLKKLSVYLGGSFPVPLPSDYLTGFDNQLALSEGGVYTGYLMGEHSLNGWWYYYLIAFIVKNPLALIILLIFTIIFWNRNSFTKPEDDLCIWIPVIMYFFYFSFLTSIPIGVRHILPIFPLIFLAAGSLVKNLFLFNKKWKLVLPAIAFAYLLPAVFVFPNYLSYFNIISGGPSNGHRWLIDSNLDWGQDLPALKNYIEAKKIDKIKLGYFGRVDPEIYGIKYSVSTGELERGIHAISINYLVGYPYYLLKSNPKKLMSVDLDYFKKYNSLKPVDVINNTIYIFKVDKVIG